MNKKGLALVTAILAFLLVALMGISAVADGARNPLAIDMVIVIENSTRMNEAVNTSRKLDQGGLRFAAAAALISMCDAKYSRANYFLFNNDLYAYSENSTGNVIKVTPDDIPLFDISLPQHKPQRQRIMDTLNGDKIRSGYGTKAGADIGKAISAAIDIQVRAENNGNRKVVLLLTSGSNTLSNASIQMAREAKKKAVENGIEIYAVALTDTASTQLLQELVTDPDNYQFANGPEDLVDVYRNFFASMIGSDPMESRSVKLDDNKSQILLEIPNNSVAEVNIILPLKRVDDLELRDPSGKIIARTEDNVMVSKSDNFISYKLISPESSTYQLTYTSADEKNIVVQYVFSYGVQVQAGVNASIINKHEPVTITAQYTVDGIPTSDEKLYNIPATLTLWKGDRLISVTEMEKDEKEYHLTFTDLAKEGIGEYTAAIHFEGDGLKRDSDPVIFELVNNIPTLISPAVNGEGYSVTINVPKNPDSYVPVKNSREWDLNSYVKDINGDTLTAKIESNTADVTAVVDGMKLSVMPRANTATQGEIHVTVCDPYDQNGPELIFPVSVENYESRYDTYTARFDVVKNIEKNSTCELTLRIYDEAGSEVRSDEQVPDEVLAVVKDADGRTMDVRMTRVGSRWTGSFATGANATDYTVSSTIPVGQKRIIADNILISSGNKAPILKQGAKADHSWNVIINEPSDSVSYKTFENTWNLDELVEDLNGDQITFEIDRANMDASVNASINSADQILTISTRLNTETDGDVVVLSKDNDGLAGPTLTFHISVKSNEEKYKLYTAELKPNGHGKSKDITVTFSVNDENNMLVTGDTNLPDTFDATYTLGNVQTPLTMTRGEDGKWTGTFRTVDTEEEYMISASVRVSDNISITAPDYMLNTTNTAPKVKKELNASGLIPETFNIQPFLIWNQETGDIVIPDLNEYFSDPDGDQLKFEVEKNFSEDQAEVSVQGNTLTIRGLKETTNPISFTVSAVDNEDVKAVGQAVSFNVKSLQKQGMILIAIVVAAIILLLILIQAMKPKYPSGAFSVSVNDVPYDLGSQLPKDGMAKKKVNLQAYAPTMAKSQYGSEIHTALSRVMMKPGYNKTVKIDATKANGINVKVNGKNERKGTLSNNGKLSISRDDKTVVFELKVNGAKAAPKKTSGSAPAKPAAHSTGAAVTNRSSSGSRT